LYSTLGVLGVTPVLQTYPNVLTVLYAVSGLVLLVYGAVVVLAALLGGPARLAVAARRKIAPVLERWPAAFFGGLVALCACLLLVGPVDRDRALLLLILCASGLTGIALLRRQVRRERG
jgi:hypothetical protein